MSSSAGSMLRQLRASCSTYLTSLSDSFDSVIQLANGCILGSTPFDYPASADCAADDHLVADEPSTCCSRACWVCCLHYLLAFTLDLMGCLPFDSALDRLASFLCLWVGLAIFEMEPGWTSLFSKGWLVTSGAGYGASCFKAWRDRSKKREEVAQQRQRAADSEHGEPMPEQQPQMQQQHVMHVRRAEEEAHEEKQALLTQPPSDEVDALHVLMLRSSHRQLPSTSAQLQLHMDKTVRTALQSERLVLSSLQDLTHERVIDAIRGCCPTHVLLFDRVVQHERAAPDDSDSDSDEDTRAGGVRSEWSFIIDSATIRAPDLVSMRAIRLELLAFNEVHSDEPIQCVVLLCDEDIHAELVGLVLSAVDFCVAVDVTELTSDACAVFCTLFPLALMEGLRIDHALQRACRGVEAAVQAEEVSDSVGLYSCAKGICRPLYHSGSQRAPPRIEPRSINVVKFARPAL